MKLEKNLPKKAIIFDKLRSKPINVEAIKMTEVKNVPLMDARVKLFYKSITQF